MVWFYKQLGSSFGIYPESDLLSPPPLTTLIQTTIILLWIYCNSLLTGLISTFALLESILNLEAKVMSVKVYAYHLTSLLKTLQWHYVSFREKSVFTVVSKALSGPEPCYSLNFLSTTILPGSISSNLTSFLRQSRPHSGSWKWALSSLIPFPDPPHPLSSF